MTKYVVGARIDERGRISGGKLGDQDGREVCVHTLASSGSWSRILRPPKNADVMVRQAYAAAANDHIGYDQSKRTTAFLAAQKVGFDISAISTDVATDCSALVGLLANCAKFSVSKDVYTGNEIAALTRAGFSSIAYSESALKPGDVLWRSGHTVIYVGTSKTYPTTAKDTEKVYAKVVDISHHNNDKGAIDFSKVKAAGYHVILKLGNYNASVSPKKPDPKFLDNAGQCEKLGIPYGVYYYGYARTEEEARGEAAWCIEQLKGRKLSYPVYYDIEEASLVGVAGKTAKAFCLAMEKAGYWAGIYSGDSYWQAHLLKVVGDRFTKWVARFGVNNGSPSYKPVTKKYDIWQYSSKGSVPGVTGNCDVNYVYRDLVKAVTGKSEKPASSSSSSASTPAKEEIRYRVRLYGSKKWLPEVAGLADYAGTYGSSIGYIAIKGVSRYRVKTAKGWLPWVSQYKVSDLDKGCAGDGSPVVAVQVDDSCCRYAVHVIGGGWLPDMVGTKDTGGSSDAFAGNGKKIDGFRARRV